MVWWLFYERGVIVSQSTVSRLLKRRKWTRKNLTRISRNRSEALRDAYKADIAKFDAEALIFLDESIFNEKTSWRHRAYAPIGHEARYSADLRRGETWSICAAMSTTSWLPCTGIKKGYYSKEDFLAWLQNRLLPAVN